MSSPFFYVLSAAFIIQFCFLPTSCDTETILSQSSLDDWQSRAVTGRTRNGFRWNSTDSSWRTSDVGDDFENFLVSPVFDIKQSKFIRVQIGYEIVPCSQLQPHYSRCTDQLTLHLIPVTSFDHVFKTSDVITANEIYTLTPEAAPMMIHSFTNDVREVTSYRRLVIADHGTKAKVSLAAVEFKLCPEMEIKQVLFPPTPASADLSPPKISGQCVKGAEQSADRSPFLLCESSGEWSGEMYMRGCVCGRGWQIDNQSCSRCPVNYYKSGTGNQRCKPCPRNSWSHTEGAEECLCKPGFKRADTEPKSVQCGNLPSMPKNLSYVVEGTHVSLSWERPENDGGRSELFYHVQCINCGYTETHPVLSQPWDHVTGTRVNITNLKPNTRYNFQVTSMNSLSHLYEATTGSFASIHFQTADNPQIVITKAEVVDGDSVVLSWESPMLSAGEQTSSRPGFQVTRLFKGQAHFKYTDQTSIVFQRLEKGEHQFRVSFRDGSGTSELTLLPSQGRYSQAEAEFKRLVFTAGIILTVVLVLIVASLTSVCLYRRSAYNAIKHAHYYPDSYGGGYGAAAAAGMQHVDNPYVDYRGGYCGYGSEQNSFIDPRWDVYGNTAESTIADYASEIDQDRIVLLNNYDTPIKAGRFGVVPVMGELLDGPGGSLSSEDGKLRNTVLVKSVDVHTNPIDRRIFLHEIAITAQLNHPNVLLLHGVVKRENPCAAVFEFAETTLEEMLRSGLANRMSHVNSEYVKPNHEIHLLRGIAMAFEYLSDIGYVHKVLRARNVYVTSDHMCKIAGFDCRAALDAESVDDLGDAPVRTELVPWFAPEVLELGKFSSASDVWAFGVLMWEVVTQGDLPWDACEVAEVRTLVLNGQTLPGPSPCSQALYQMMMECWGYDPKARPGFTHIRHNIELLLRQRSHLAQQLSLGGGNTIPRRTTLDFESSSYCSSNVNREFTVEEWLTSFKLAQYVDLFTANNFILLSDVVLADLDDKQLKKLGVSSSSHRRTMLNFLSLRKQQDHKKSHLINYYNSFGGAGQMMAGPQTGVPIMMGQAAASVL